MSENTSEKKVIDPRTQRLKYYWSAAIAGAVAALSGAFAYCVYDGYTRLHQGWCDCIKYGALVAGAFSHPIAIIGALAGVTVLMAGLMVRYLYRGYYHHRHRDLKDGAK